MNRPTPTRRNILSALVAMPAIAACQQDGPQTGGNADLPEEALRIPVPAASDSAEMVELDATLIRPAGPGPFPLVIMSHGQPMNPAEARRMPRLRFLPLSRLLVQEGHAVLLPMRRGYANSGGQFRSGTGNCGNLTPLNNARLTAEDIEATRVWAVANLPFVNARHVILAGQSAGGYGSLFAGSRGLGGVVGVMNFSGGIVAGALPGPGGGLQLCDGWQDAVADSFETMGRGPGAAGLPTLWLYSANDSVFGAALSRRFFEAYRRGGGQGQFVALPAIGSDGHMFLQNPSSAPHWTGPVRSFLAERRAAAVA